MNGLDPKMLGAILDTLRAKGVRSFQYEPQGGAMRVEFSPAEPPPVAPGPAVQEDPPCKCGHPYHQHNEMGLCLIGCEADKCAPAEK